MHQTLKHQIKHQGHDIIRLWELFDETVRYEEDPSGVNAGFVAVQTKREMDYKAYEDCRRQIDGLTKGTLKVHRDKAVKTVQTLFLYHVAKTRQAGISSEEIANAVLIERKEDATPEENIQHYETLTENLRKELRQITQSFDEDNAPRYRFDPVFSGVDPRLEFQKARDEAESNQALLRETWDYLLGLDEWLVKTRQMTIDLSNGVKSMFRAVAPPPGRGRLYAGGQSLDVTWQGRQVTGLVEMRDLARMSADNTPLPGVETDQSDRDFAVFIGTRLAPPPAITKLLAQRRDPRVLLWTPAELTAEEQDRLRDFAAYRKLVTDWEGKDSEDAVGVINWVSSTLQTEMGKIARIIDTSFGRGRIDALNNTQMEFHVAGELAGVLSPLVDRVLSTAYESRDIKFEPPFTFRKEEGVKVINGIVKTGSIPKGAKPNQDISAAQNFGYGLKIIKRSAEKELDTADNPYVADLWGFIDDKLSDEGQTMRLDTLYKNFMGIGGPKDYGLTRRMVQIYLLCLVRQGKVRVALGPKSGLPIAALDYATIADVEFSARVLDALTEAQKMAQPRNWDAVRPYAEKLLGATIPVTHDDAEIARWRVELRALFAREKDQSARAVTRARGLFDALQVANPYQAELEGAARLFATDISSGDDIALLLYGLKEALEYRAFDDETAAQGEVDDLANRLANYHDLARFLDYDTDLRAAHAYSTAPLPDIPELATARTLRQELGRKLGDVRPYIDAEVRLKTELIGYIPPAPGETGTFGALVGEYMTVYVALHETALGRLDAARRGIQRHVHNSNELRALMVLEGITALQPAVSGQVHERLSALEQEIFVCPSPSRTSIEDDLKNGPLHRCGLSFDNADGYVAQAQIALEQATGALNDALDRKMDVLLSPAVRDRLAQGMAEPVIRDLLTHQDSADLRAYLVDACLQETALVETANRYLKRIVVKKVRLADFHPSVSTIEKAGIGALALEFQQFLEEQLRGAGEDGDTLPMLQVE